MFRRRGAASLSLQWGIDKADEMNAKAFIEASMDGAHLYEKFGFVTKNIMDLHKDDMEDDPDDGSGARPEPISTWDEAEDFEGDDLEIEGGVKLERRNWDDEDEEIGAGEVETPELAAKRRAGQKKAEEREFIRCVVRRAVVFGIEVEGWKEVGGGEESIKKGKKGKGRNAEEDQEVSESEVKPRRKCEAIMSGQIVEPSFAKGDWSVRWRDE